MKCWKTGILGPHATCQQCAFGQVILLLVGPFPLYGSGGSRSCLLPLRSHEFGSGNILDTANCILKLMV